ncbi:cytochrome o ubiquinol oxidase subunit IV [Brevibacillus composti]|uniref:Cytochrome o ubiquinol oxidase subunit IV n=1 Tax=Brevibacillus composti TaxID=2796470 RepID=A0A7T5EJB0_9BACL|nr:cytochrome o ubiquinol oxidase subunit IV [Brevibacillus composti]QQE73659.1 cytochrome o ubiquinol oxidase subunit IV [Brevibacillus composti]QUO40741.1 cytochrome o ubiquinol oxidase subunit IV [Brevibacillus composti]
MAQHENHGENHGTFKSYVTGFVLSIILTIIPLVLVMNHILTGTALVVTIMLMAVAQLFVQLFFFMHIREGEKPRYNVQALVLGAVIVFTIVAGSMWIMTFNSQVQ